MRLPFKSAGNTTSLRFSIAMLLLLVGSAVAVRGQTILDSFDPNVNGTVNAVIVQSDGKILIGGAFTFAAGLTVALPWYGITLPG